MSGRTAQQDKGLEEFKAAVADLVLEDVRDNFRTHEAARQRMRCKLLDLLGMEVQRISEINLIPKKKD